MTKELENLIKSHSSIKQAVADLKEVIKTDDLLLYELVMHSLKTLSEEETKISRLITIIQNKI